MRVGEVTQSEHVLKAKDVNIGTNKDKLLFILYSSKTHDKGNRPQRIKINSNRDEKSGHYVHRHVCPFRIIKEYYNKRGNYKDDDEPFFIFRDGTPVKPCNANAVLKQAIDNLGLDSSLYSMHSFRIGRATDLIRYGYTIEQVKRMGRWRSNAVYKYIRM